MFTDLLNICRYVGRLGNGSLIPSDPIAEMHMNEILGNYPIS